MKRKSWAHSVLHIGCVLLLLLQGNRIRELRKEAKERSSRETSATERLFDTQLALTSVQLRLEQVCSNPKMGCAMK